MPPKQGKKPSKAEKERLKREEAERKAREEEEARLKAEQEEKDRQERVKKDKEERQRLEDEEKKKRKGQLDELNSQWEAYVSTMRDQENGRRRTAKWDRYMRCDGSPDPSIEAEINTYINLYREDTTVATATIEGILKESKLILELIAELEFVIDDTPEDEVILPERQRFKNTTAELQKLLKEKLDLASHMLSLKATDLRDPETMNLQKTVTTDYISLCMWGNLSKNPRIRSFEFENTGLHFDIPRLLTLSDIAFRLLITKYDHFTGHTSSFQPKVKELRPESVIKEASVKEEAPPAEDKQAEGEGEEQANPDAPAASREVTDDISKLLNKVTGEDDEQTEEKPEVEDTQPEDDVQSNPDLPDYEEFEGEEDEVDMRANVIIGPIYHFDLIELPPQPKATKDMILNQKVEPAVMHFFPYVADDIPEADGEKQEELKEKKDEKQVKKDEKPPIAMSIKVPDHIALFEEPQVCRWDYKSKVWKTVGFTDEKFNEEDRVLSFKAHEFGTFGLLQDSHINLPYQSWEMRPRGTNHTHFTLIAAIAELEIDIKDDKLCVTEPIKLDAVEFLQDKWMSFRDFKKTLMEYGVNIFPREDSHKFVNLTKKRNSVTEDRMYQQMAMVASSMAFSWSDWNNKQEDLKTFVILGCEKLDEEPILEEDWKMLMITKRRTKMLRMVEAAETFSDEHAEGTEFHADLYHMALQMTSEAGHQQINNTSHQFVNTVYKFLKATEMAVFS